MKKTLLGLLCLFMLSAALFADMSKQELQKMYLTWLRGQGISAQVDDDGDIEFEYEGEHFNAMTYYIMVDEKDQQFFRVMRFGGYTLDTPQEKRQGPLAASEATRRARVAKMFLNANGDNIRVSAETFLVSPQDFMAVFPKLMSGIERAILEFINKMDE